MATHDGKAIQKGSWGDSAAWLSSWVSPESARKVTGG